MSRLLTIGIPRDAGFKLGLFLSAMQALSTLALMATSAFLISYSSEQPPILYLMLAVVGVRAFALGRAVFRYGERWFLHNSVFKMMSDLRPKLFTALVPLAPGGLRQIRKGDQLSRFNSDVENIQNLSLRVIGPVLQSVFALLLASVFLLFLDPFAAVAIFASGSLAIVFALLVSYLIGIRANASLAELKSELEESLVDYFQRRELLKAFDWESSTRSRIAELSKRIQKIESTNALSTGLSASIFSLLTVIATVSVAVPASISVQQGSLAGSLLAVVILIPLALFDVFSSLQPASGFFQRYVSSAKRVTELLDADIPKELEAIEGNRRMDQFDSLEFKNISLKYPDSDELIKDVSFRVEAQQWLAIEGPSGSGKTTLALAAVGLLAPLEGAIKLNGAYSENFELESIREKIGLIEQQPHIFAGTVRQNLLIAGDTLQDVEIIESLQTVGLWQMFDARQGLDTELGERGQALSGGEMQRLSIARAVLAGYELLILDEPTSALDRESALQLMSLLKSLQDSGKTLITITHDPEIASFADSSYRLREQLSSKAADVS